jgi:murein DD-endopeptidase MepM/ murein hydrolase activator NlpD
VGRRHACLALCALLVALAVPLAAAAGPSARVAAVAATLRSAGFYAGDASLADAAAPGAVRRDRLGNRTLRLHARGWAVRELQLALAWQGFPSGAIDGRFGSRLGLALRRFQRASRLRADGVAGGATVSDLRVAPPRPAIPLAWPLLAPVGDRFGPRGDRFHAGVDLLASARAPVVAAAPGRVAWAGPRSGGWGNLVTIGHAGGVSTMYAHLSRTDVRVGDWVAAGTVIGRVGSTGDATGPHLHFEVRLHGGAVDPLRALVALTPGTY